MMKKATIITAVVAVVAIIVLIVINRAGAKKDIAESVCGGQKRSV